MVIDKSDVVDSCFDVKFTSIGYKERQLNQLQAEGKYTYPMALSSDRISLKTVDVIGYRQGDYLSEVMGAMTMIVTEQRNDEFYMHYVIDGIDVYVK